MNLFHKILVAASLFFAMVCSAQESREGNARYFEPVLDGEVVYRGPDVVFRKLGDRTWMGSGHVIASETMYLLEGKSRALLIDTGASIKDLDKIVKCITDKPVTVVLTHSHGDHSGNIGCFPEVWVAPEGTSSSGRAFRNYSGSVKSLSNGQKFDLGGRTIEVLFAPGHTSGSAIFLDPSMKCGFSGSAFGSGNLNLGTDLSTFIHTAKNTLSVMKKKKIRIMYPGHYFGDNPDTPERISAISSLAEDILSGKVKGTADPEGASGHTLVVRKGNMRINYSSERVK